MKKPLSPETKFEKFIAENFNATDVAVQSGQVFARFDDETDAEIAKGAIQACGGSVYVTAGIKSGFTLTGSIYQS